LKSQNKDLPVRKEAGEHEMGWPICNSFDLLTVKYHSQCKTKDYHQHEQPNHTQNAPESDGAHKIDKHNGDEKISDPARDPHK
jgi:hypothetical protein